MAFKYFNVKNGLVTGNILLHASNSSISANAFTGNLNVTSTANLGNVGNVIITGGVANYVLSTDGTGNLNWVAQTGGTATANIQILDEGNILTNSVSSINFVGLGVVANNTGNAVTVTISGGEASSSISNGNSNVVVQANSNVNVSVSGIPNILVVSGLGANVTGTLSSDNANLGNTVTANYFTGTLTTSAQPNITSVGTLSLLAVTGNITSGNANLGNLVTANFFSGNGSLLTGITSAANANYANFAGTAYSVSGANVSGQVSNALIAGTVYTNAQPNITSVGTLTSLAVTGNVTSGNANLGNLVTANFFTGNGSLLTGITAATSANANYANFAGNAFSVSGSNVSGEVANANYATFAGTANSVSGSNVTGQVGNALIAGTVYTNAQPNITSVGTLSNLSVTGNITSTNANLGNLVTANFFSGNGSLLTGITATTSANANYANFAGNAFSVSGSNVTGQVANANYAAFSNTAFNVSGSNVSGQVGNALVAGTVYTNAQPNITSVGTLSNLAVTGNISSGNANLGNLVIANFFSGDGSLLTGITANAANSNYANFAGTVLTNAQPNITSVGTLTSLGVSGNITAANITANTGVFTGNGSGLRAIAGANVTGTVANATFATTAGTVTTNAQPNITSVGTLTSLGVTGNVSGNYFIGNGALLTGVPANTSLINGNSNVVVTLNGNVTVSVSGTANSVVVTSTGINSAGYVNAVGNINGANITGTHYGAATGLTGIPGANVTGTVANATFATTAGTVTTNAQPNITSVGTLTSLGVSGNITAANITANTGVFTGNGSGLRAIAGANVTGTVANATFATTAGTVTTNAQPNITSTGTLSNLVVNGNVVIGGGSGGNIANANVISANTFIGNGSQLTDVIAVTAGTVTTNAQPNITSVGTLSNLSVTGNITSGNANLGNLVVANFFSGNGSLLTGITSAANANYANFAGTVTTNAQSNITSVGTLSALTVGPNSSIVLSGSSGFIKANSIQGVDGTAAIYTYYGNVSGAVGIYSNLTVGTGGSGNLIANSGKVIFGNVDNITITGGTANYVLSTDGTGNLNWVAQSGGGGGGGSSISNGTSNVSIATANGNITMSVGGTSNVFVTSNTGVTVSGISNLGNVGNVKITGGTANYVLGTDGTGNLNWVAQSGGGGTANIQILDEGNILTNSVSSINFVGAGVTASNTGNAVTVTIIGGTTASQVYGLGTVFSFGG